GRQRAPAPSGLAREPQAARMLRRLGRASLRSILRYVCARPSVAGLRAGHLRLARSFSARWMARIGPAGLAAKHPTMRPALGPRSPACERATCDSLGLSARGEWPASALRASLRNTSSRASTPRIGPLGLATGCLLPFVRLFRRLGPTATRLPAPARRRRRWGASVLHPWR